jgi:hypothetical protein
MSVGCDQRIAQTAGCAQRAIMTGTHRQVSLLLDDSLRAIVRDTGLDRGDFDGGRQQPDELVELGEARLERHAVEHLELHADAEAVYAVRVVHRAHRQQVLEQLAALAIVGQLDVAIDATTQRVLDHRHRLRLGEWALQEAAVAALALVLCVAGHAAKLLVGEHHRVARDRAVANHYARREGLRHARKRVQPPSNILRRLILVPQQVVDALQLFVRTANQPFDQRQARLRLHKLGEAALTQLHRSRAMVL